MRRRAPIACQIYCMTRLALAAVVGGLLVGPSVLGLGAIAAAQGDSRAQAREHYASGRRLYDQGDYRGAIREFAAADALAPSGLNDFNIALCHDKLGEPGEAVRFYRSYLSRAPDAPNRAQVEASVARLEQQIAAAKAAEDAKRAEEAERAKKEAEAHAAEEAKKAAEAAAAAPIHPPEPAIAPAPSTGDPELDRVVAIDVNAIRDQRRGATPASPASTPQPPAPGAAALPPSSPSSSESLGSSSPTAPEQPAPVKGKDETPVYRKWWFWGIAAVSVIVVVSMFDDDGDDSDSAFRALTTPGSQNDVQPVPLFRF